jgi:hypothetical protein
MAKEKMDVNLKKVTTHEFRVSFPQVFAPKSFNNGEPKYSVTMLFPKNVDLAKKPAGAKSGVSMKEAVFNCLKEEFGADKAKWPKGLKLPFRDGNEKPDFEGYKDSIFVRASSKKKPGLVDQGLQSITHEESFYPGCYARATLIAFYYDTAGNKGVSFSLQNLQKTRDGENMSGRKRAEDEFDSIEDGSESQDNYSDDNFDID